MSDITSEEYDVLMNDPVKEVERPVNEITFLTETDPDRKIRVKDFAKVKTSNLIIHALDEFKYVGWMNDDYEFAFDKDNIADEEEIFGMTMQEAICVHILKLLMLVANEGHSGTSLPYAVQVFTRLVNFKPISALKDIPEEWGEVSDGLYQHKRCGSVFKNDKGEAWDNDAVIFYNKKEDSYYMNRHSCRSITFPYFVPTRSMAIEENFWYKLRHFNEYFGEWLQRFKPKHIS